MSARWGPGFDWSEANVATLRKLWVEGKSATQIAKALGGGLSRNAVIGKVHRLGLQGRATPSRPRRVRKALRPASTLSATTGLPRVAAPPPGASNEQRRAHFAGEGAAVLRRSLGVSAEALAVSIAWGDLRRGQCAWILGETDGAASHCCGQPVDPAAADSSLRRRYCAAHGALALAAEQPRLTRKRSAERVDRGGFRDRGEPAVFDRGARGLRTW